MFVHISPEPDAVGETLSTLKFAERVSTVELGAARINKDNSDVKELKEQVCNLYFFHTAIYISFFAWQYYFRSTKNWFSGRKLSLQTSRLWF